jgi:hypothetical protein
VRQAGGHCGFQPELAGEFEGSADVSTIVINPLEQWTVKVQECLQQCHGMARKAANNFPLNLRNPGEKLLPKGCGVSVADKPIIACQRPP